MLNFLKKNSNKCLKMYINKQLRTDSHITISQSSARISQGEEPEGAETVGTKPGTFGNNKQTFIWIKHKRGMGRDKTTKADLVNWMSSHCLLSLSQKACNI